MPGATSSFLQLAVEAKILSRNWHHALLFFTKRLPEALFSPRLASYAPEKTMS